jgi:hypothetical protein
MRVPARWLVLLATAAGLVLLLACVLVFPRLLHPPLSATQLRGVPSADRRVELQNDARATLLQGIAGLLLLAGAVATWRQVQVNREGQITERFTRAIDQLGSSTTDVRLGGIFTLARIAKDSPADRPTVATVLAAFVRTHAPWMVGAPDGPEHPTATVGGWRRGEGDERRGRLGGDRHPDGRSLGPARFEADTSPGCLPTRQVVALDGPSPLRRAGDDRRHARANFVSPACPPRARSIGAQRSTTINSGRSGEAATCALGPASRFGG